MGNMSTRRRFLTLLGGASTITVAGCSSTGSDSTVSETPTREEVTPTQETTYTPDGTRTNNPGNVSDGTPTMTREEAVQPGPEQGEDMDLTGREHYFNWIHGENDKILEEVQGTEKRTSISFDAIDQALEEGMNEGGRNQAVAQALETASQQYTATGDYEDRHTHILSALHQTLEQKRKEEDTDKWGFKIDSRLDATPSTDGWQKFSRIDVETNQKTEQGNKKYDAIYGTLTQDRNHLTHHPGEQTSAENTTHRLLQEIRNADTYNARSLVDEDAIENAIEGYDWDEEMSYDQTGLQIGILLGGGINVDSDYEETSVIPEHVLASEEGREEEILEIVDEYEEKGDMTLRNKMRERYFNNGHDQYEASEVDIQADGSVGMEEIDDFSMADRIADA